MLSAFVCRSCQGSRALTRVFPSRTPRPRRRPGLHAPQGIENGADAVYSAWIRALTPAFVRKTRRHRLAAAYGRSASAGLKGYVALNTLIFTSELPDVGGRRSQNRGGGRRCRSRPRPSLVRMIRSICSDLPDPRQHANDANEQPNNRGRCRAWRQPGSPPPRMFHQSEIRRIRSKSEHPGRGFLFMARSCVAYSGQCLTSESLGGRSAKPRPMHEPVGCPTISSAIGDIDLGERKYAASPQDLAAST